MKVVSGKSGRSKVVSGKSLGRSKLLSGKSSRSKVVSGKSLGRSKGVSGKSGRSKGVSGKSGRSKVVSWIIVPPVNVRQLRVPPSPGVCVDNPVGSVRAGPAGVSHLFFDLG